MVVMAMNLLDTYEKTKPYEHLINQKQKKPTKLDDYPDYQLFLADTKQSQFIQGVEFVCPNCAKALFITYNKEGHNISLADKDSVKEIDKAKWTMQHSDTYMETLQNMKPIVETYNGKKVTLSEINLPTIKEGSGW